MNTRSVRLAERGLHTHTHTHTPALNDHQFLRYEDRRSVCVNAQARRNYSVEPYVNIGISDGEQNRMDTGACTECSTYIRVTKWNT